MSVTMTALLTISLPRRRFRPLKKREPELQSHLANVAFAQLFRVSVDSVTHYETTKNQRKREKCAPFSGICPPPLFGGMFCFRPPIAGPGTTLLDNISDVSAGADGCSWTPIPARSPACPRTRPWTSP